MENNLLAIEDFKKELYTTINDSNLSISTIYYVVKDLYNEVIYLYNQALVDEKKKKEEADNQEVIE